MIYSQSFVLIFSIFFIRIILSSDIQIDLIRTDSLYQAGLHDQSFALTKKIYNQNSSNFEVIYRMARSIFIKAQNEKNNKKKMQYYYKGLKEAKKALQLAPNNGYANFWVASYLGRIGELEGTKQSIINSYEVKKYALIAIELEPEYDASYHMMGRWHYELANLNDIEKKIASLVYAELPKGSYLEAVSFFKKAIKISPNEIRHHFWLAKTYYAMGNKELSSKHFRIVNSLNSKDSEDRDFQIETIKYIKNL